MKKVIEFLLFIIYSTCIFFFPNTKLILIFLSFNIIVSFFMKLKIKEMVNSILKFLPFILFTFIINCVLDELKNSIYIGIKLIIVCNTTFIYSNTISVTELAKTIKLLVSPLKIFHVNTDDIEVMICISLSMIPILKRELREIKEAVKAKNMMINVKNSKIILSKFFISIMIRVNEIEEALIAKGYDL